MMRIDKIPGFPFYVFLIPVFYIWHKMNEYFGLVPIKLGALILLEYWVITLIFFVVLWRLLRNVFKAAICTAFTLVFYLFWGSIHDLLKSWLPNSFFTGYSFLLPLLVLCIIAIGLYQYKAKRSPLRWTRFLNWLTIVLLLMEMGISTYSTLIGKTRNAPIEGNPEVIISKQDLILPTTPPDIYLIVFDEYPSSRSLKKYLDFDNSEIDSIFQKNHFLVASNSMSNYNLTPLSVASALNMQYFPTDIEKYRNDTRARMQGQLAMARAQFPILLKESGYSIHNHGLMNIAYADSPFEPIFEPDKELVIRYENLPKRIEREIWWNFVVRFRFLQDSPEDRLRKLNKLAHVTTFNYKNLMNEFDDDSKSPKFVYAHFMLPHPPFLFDRKGTLRTSDTYGSTPDKDSLFLDQVVYSNTILQCIAEKSANDSGKQKIVIIIGDHGYRDNYVDFDKRIREKQFMNLTAIYSDDHNYRGFYDSISPVNIFRVVLNEHFGTNLPMLKDSTIMLE